ncbi:GNAT family N-acetyltransferase [Sphingobium lignivorans]|uniref:Ribosomal protein S18 acetylase RimI-like enzyme n=1 Tax=Sphingobium lignivorans TaxID=2735886 RepID=A0ABR6NIE5_9SPHN|nr:GNAT family N-acetyltransferase [Sphingobium lignivorans]MBB5987057.1 ribosomal protein S18 acetylase RimI-like enzyme [Sphingobium lignivorans]
MADTSPTPRIRPATRHDVPALAALKLRCFRETFLEDFAVPYPPADLGVFERTAYGEPTIAAEISASDHATWVCEAGDGALVGYAHAGPCKLPHPDVTDRSGELYQLYLRRDAQGMGLGRRLVTTALDWLDEHFPGPLWLGVWSGNARAIAVYQSLGFRKAGEYQFMVGNHRDDEYILRRD